MQNRLNTATKSTPLINLREPYLPTINLYAKLEGFNPTGSVKDRAAYYILDKALRTREINKNTLILESSSGNFGIALAARCAQLGLKFYCVIDENISPTNETIIRSLGAQVHKISEPDEKGGYLLNRIEKTKELLASHKNAYWVNQYANPYNAEAYYETLGKEIYEEVKNIGYLFIGVSSGGTISGVSRKIRELSPETRIIAVDAEGSVIFGGQSKKRFIPGIGSSMVPEILKSALIDEVIHVPEKMTVEACHDFLKRNNIRIGGSSGTVMAAIRLYFKDKCVPEGTNIVTIFPDRGERYVDTIYNKDWCLEKFNMSP